MTFQGKSLETPSESSSGSTSQQPAEEMCDTSLGRYLYNARADKGITVAALSQKTHIPVTTLQALESDDFEHLPGRIFVVGFIRAYARCLGFDEQEAIRRYDQAQKLSVTPVPSQASLVTLVPSPAPAVSAPPSAVGNSGIPQEAQKRTLADVIDGVIPLAVSLAALAAAIAVCLSVGTDSADDASGSAQDSVSAVSKTAQKISSGAQAAEKGS